MECPPVMILRIVKKKNPFKVNTIRKFSIKELSGSMYLHALILYLNTIEQQFQQDFVEKLSPHPQRLMALGLLHARDEPSPSISRSKIDPKTKRRLDASITTPPPGHDINSSCPVRESMSAN
jgi:hypothetical protein